MSDVPNYRRATNMAYTTLRALNVSMLPITIFPAIAQIPNLRVISYSEACDRFRMSWQEYISLNVSERGYICREGKKAIIFYNDRIDPEIIRFTIAHELGHFVLGHMDETSSADKEANCFARNFLCPVPVTDYWELADVGECCDIFDITPPRSSSCAGQKAPRPHKYGFGTISEHGTAFRTAIINKRGAIKASFRASYAGIC